MRATSRIILVITGALSFWIPALLTPFFLAGALGNITQNVVAVVCATGVYLLLRSWGAKQVAIHMLVGMYVLCPLLISLEAQILGSTHAPPVTSRTDILWLLISCVFPPMTLLWAGYAGAFFGLLAESVILIGAACTQRSWPR